MYTVWTIEQHSPDKLMVSISYITPIVYKVISNCSTYNETIHTLMNMYDKYLASTDNVQTKTKRNFE